MEDILLTILIIILTFLTSFLFWAYKQSTYWQRKKVPYIPGAIIFGNFVDLLLMKYNPGELFTSIYRHENGKDQPVIGINVFHKPSLLIKDLELIKQILVKDFNKFSNRYTAVDNDFDKLGSGNLFMMKNPDWRELRILLTTFFSSGKMKQMFSLINDVGKVLHEKLTKISTGNNSKQELELRELCALYTTDVVASVAFGLEANSLINPNGEFRQNGKKFFLFTWKRSLQFMFVFFIPQLVNVLRFQLFDDDIKTFLRTTTKFTMDERRKSGIKRNDLIDILINWEKEEKVISEKRKLSGDILVAQAATFFLAGFETSSSTMSFTLYELSKNLDVQKRLREEIRKVLRENNGDIPYTTLTEMTYLNAVVSEALRMYPPLPFLDRECTLSAEEIGYSLEPIVDFKVPNKMPIYISTFGLHYDPQYFPNPNVFDPERFMPENKDKIFPYSYLPFGSGPHNCIGERLGLMQTKVGLLHFLRNHFVTCSPRSEVLKFDKKALNLQPLEGIFCHITRDSLYP